MSELAINGKIVKILDPINGTSKAGKEWNKQEFVIETTDQYPKSVCFTLFGDKVELIQGLNIGDEVNVSFNIESREFNERWFHNINAWKVAPFEKSSEEINHSDNYSKALSNEPTEATADDLPF